MRTIEYLCYLGAALKGLLLFALPIHWVLVIVVIEIVAFPFYALYVGTTARPGGEADEENPHQRAFRIIQKCIFIYLPALGVGAYLFGVGK